MHQHVLYALVCLTMVVIEILKQWGPNIGTHCKNVNAVHPVSSVTLNCQVTKIVLVLVFVKNCQNSQTKIVQNCPKLAKVSTIVTIFIDEKFDK